LPCAPCAPGAPTAPLAATVNQFVFEIAGVLFVFATFAIQLAPEYPTTSPTAYAVVELHAPRQLNPFAPCGPCGPVWLQDSKVVPVGHVVAGGFRYCSASVVFE